jgi:hypothetical protein
MSSHSRPDRYTKKQVKRGERTKLDELVLHEPCLAQGQVFEQATGLFDRRHVHEEDGACLSLFDPPLVDLTI